MKTPMIIIGILSLVVTLISPFVFSSYFEEKPESLHQNIVFGGPFPFVEQTHDFPVSVHSYPFIVEFASPFENETSYKITPLILSFLSYYLLFFALYSIFTRIFSGKYKPEKSL